MYTPMTSKHFAEHINDKGVRFWVLTTHVAPIQQGFYFANSGASDDGRYLWFYCAFPPAEGWCTGVVDFLADEVRCFPETRGGAFMVDPLTGELYWSNSQGIFKRSPDPADKPVKVASVPEELRKLRVGGIGSHMQLTPDRKELLADVQTAAGSYIGTFALSDGHFTLWYHTEPGVPFNHAQICPTDGDRCLCAYEHSYDLATGTYTPPPKTAEGIYPRLQIIGRDGSREMRPPYRNSATHEFWGPSGKTIYYCSYHGVARDRLDGTPAEPVFVARVEGGNGAWHAHCDRTETYFVVDGSHLDRGLKWWRGCPSMVRFWNDESKKMVDIVSYQPTVEGWTPENPSIYHIDPHPRFVLQDRYITFTTTVLGKVDLAITETAPLMEMTK